MKILKDEKKGKKIPAEEKLRLYKILKVNKPIVDMLSQAHVEALRSKEEEDHLRKLIEQLRNKKELTEDEKKKIRTNEREKNKFAIEMASIAFKEKAKELNANDLPLISSKLESLEQMKKKAKDKRQEQMIDEYKKELIKDKVAIIKAIKERNRKKIKKLNSTTINTILEENKNERDKLKAKSLKQIEIDHIEKEKQQAKKMPKAKVISFKNVKIPEGIKVYRNQKLNDQVFQDEIFKPIKKNLCPIRENGTWNLPHGIHKEDIRGWEKYNWTPVNNILDTPNYQVYFDDINSDDILQGDFQNCYFITALAALCKYPELVKKLFLFKEKSQEHVYGVYLRVNGTWKLILIDDFVPFYFDSEGAHRFVFSSSYQKELWVVLLEKAWAKLNGNYAHSLDGSPSEVFDALTDAYTEILYV